MNRFRNSFPFRQASAVEFFLGGEAYFHFIENAIRNAKFEVLIQLYILEADTTGIQMMNALMMASRRGVKVYMLLDSYGSKELPEFWIKSLEDSGVKVNWYAPLSQAVHLRMGLRLHHKLLVVDRNLASCGGINWSNHYKGTAADLPWLDFALVFKGDPVLDVIKVMRRYFPWTQMPPNLKSYPYSLNAASPDFRVIENNWFRSKLSISFYYRRGISNAKREITVVASYFIPGSGLKRKLKNAAERGVEVNLLLGARSDIGLMKRAIRYFYPDLLKAGVRLFEYKPTVLHGKLVLLDGVELCVGSYNLNYLSDFGSVECNVVCKDKDIVAGANDLIKTILLNDATEIKLDEFFKTNGPWNRFLDRIAYSLLSFGLSILFFFQDPRTARDLSDRGS